VVVSFWLKLNRFEDLVDAVTADYGAVASYYFLDLVNIGCHRIELKSPSIGARIVIFETVLLKQIILHRRMTQVFGYWYLFTDFDAIFTHFSHLKITISKFNPLDTNTFRFFLC
jgi:hypothetical protein